MVSINIFAVCNWSGSMHWPYRWIDERVSTFRGRRFCRCPIQRRPSCFLWRSGRMSGSYPLSSIAYSPWNVEPIEYLGTIIIHCNLFDRSSSCSPMSLESGSWSGCGWLIQTIKDTSCRGLLRSYFGRVWHATTTVVGDSQIRRRNVLCIYFRNSQMRINDSQGSCVVSGVRHARFSNSKFSRESVFQESKIKSLQSQSVNT